jgi:amidase
MNFKGEKMPKLIKSDKFVFAMAKENKPAMTVESGETVKFIVNDALNGQVKSADARIDELDWNAVNPATGPLFVKGAMPGDLFKIEIIEIKLAETAAMITGKDIGVCAGFFDRILARVMRIDGGSVNFSDKIKIPLRPMIGVIGVAPESGRVNCGTPGEHGGNMDCKEVREGATLYLRVFAEGGLLAVGDLHGAMGDGEVSGCGAEAPGEATLKVSVIKGKELPTPFISGEKAFMTIASSATIDEAIDQAALRGIEFLMNETKMTHEEAVSFISLACDVRVCQIVDPLKTARLEMPKELLSQIKGI